MGETEKQSSEAQEGGPGRRSKGQGLMKMIELGNGVSLVTFNRIMLSTDAFKGKFGSRRDRRGEQRVKI